MPSKFSSKGNQEEGTMTIQEEVIATPEFLDQVEMETTPTLTTQEGTTTINEETIVNPEFSGQVELGTVFSLMIEE